MSSKSTLLRGKTSVQEPKKIGIYDEGALAKKVVKNFRRKLKSHHQ